MSLNKLVSYKFSIFFKTFQQVHPAEACCTNHLLNRISIYDSSLSCLLCQKESEILQYRWECNFIMSICRMIFFFPVRLIWFHQLKSPTKKNRSKHFDLTKRVGKKSLDKNQSRVFALLIVDARIALQTKLPLSLLICQFQLPCSVSISFANTQFS